MAFSSLRVACAELLCLTLLASHLVGPTFLFADEEALIASPTSLLAPDVSVHTIDSSLTAAVLTSSGVPKVLLYTGSTILSSVSEILPSSQKQDQMISETSEPISDHLNQNEILIQFKEASVDLDTYAGKYQLTQIENSHDLTTTDTLSDENIAVMKIDALSQNLLTVGSITNKDTINFEIEKTVDTTIAELKKDPRVARVQRNFVYKLSTSSTRAIQSSHITGFTPSAFSGRSVPNDSNFENLWGLDNHGQDVNGISGTDDADIDYPEAIAYASGKLSTGVIVAVLDTGIGYNHPDLVAHMWNGTSCVSDTGAILGGCIHGYDFAYGDNDPNDGHFHGTHVAGTIGAVTSNGMGVTGVAPNVQLMAVKILNDEGYGYTADIIRGINFAKRNGAKVINASFGGVEFVRTKSDFDYLSYEAIQSFPGLFIAAAGNDGTDFDNGAEKNFPSGFGSDTVVSGEIIIDREIVYSGTEIIPGLSNVISVAATDQNDNLAYFSNYGTGGVHIAAPGTNIYSTVRKQVVSSEISPVGYAYGWNKQSVAAGTSWTTRAIAVVSGEFLGDTPDFSTALWGNTQSPYVSGENSYIETTVPSGNKNINDFELGFWCDTPDSSFSIKDHLEILISTGGLYRSLANIDETQLQYQNSVDIDGHPGKYGTMDFSLGGYEVGNGPLDIRVRWHTDTIDDEEGGVYHYGCAVVGDMKINRTEYQLDYDYLDGTSMATPHVVGAAALAWSFKPDATPDEIRNAIMAGADYKPQLQDKVMYGRRLNVMNMLQAAVRPILISTKVVLSGESAVKIQTEGTDYLSEVVLISKNPHFYGDTGYLPYADLLAENSVITKKDTEDAYNISGNMTRGELAKIAANLGGYVPTTCSGNVFSDVNLTLSGSEFCGYIEALALAGRVPTLQAQFFPNSMVTRVDMYSMIVAAIGEAPSSVSQPFTDIGDLSPDEQGYIYRAAELGCGGSDIDGKVHPHDQVIRGDIFYNTVCIAGLLDSIDIKQASAGDLSENEFIFEALTSDTQYYYQVSLCGYLYCNIESNQSYGFRTPKLVSNTLTIPVSVSGSIYLSGATSTGIVFSGSTSSGLIILTNSGTAARVDIPTRGLIINAVSGTWDGILQAPSLATGTSITTSGGIIPVTIIYKIGSYTSPLSLSGQVATISIPVQNTNGFQLPVYRSDGIGLPYTQMANCLVVNNLCTFTTDHFSFFAVGNPIIIPSTPSGSSGAGGGSVAANISSYGTYTIPLTEYVPLVLKTQIIPQSIVPTSTGSEDESTKNGVFKTAKKTIIEPFKIVLDKVRGSDDKLSVCDSFLKNLETQKKIASREQKKILQSAITQAKKIRNDVIKNMY